MKKFTYTTSSLEAAKEFASILVEYNMSFSFDNEKSIFIVKGDDRDFIALGEFIDSKGYSFSIK